MLIDLNNKVAVVTGGSNGIGKIIVKRLLAEGVNVSVWDIDEKGLQNLKKIFKKFYNSSKLLCIKCDVSKDGDVSSAVKKTINSFGKVDIGVLNAGVAIFSKLESMSESEWQNVFDINSKGVFFCSKHLIPYMKTNNFGRLIIASSFASIIPSVEAAAYSASKSSVNSITRVLAAELGPWNITVNSYAPGMIPSNMSKIDSMPKKRQKEMLETLSIYRWGEADDIANLIIFLSSEFASYITGSLIDISGGKFSVQFAKMARN